MSRSVQRTAVPHGPGQRERGAPLLREGFTQLRPASPTDALQVAANLRADDRRDIEAVSSLAPSTAILASMRRAERSFAIVHDATCVGIAGVRPAPDYGLGVVWLLGTQGLSEIITQGAWRFSRRWVQYMCFGYRQVHNYVPLQNAMSRRWLRRLGFIEAGTVPSVNGRGIACVDMRFNPDPASGSKLVSRPSVSGATYNV